MENLDNLADPKIIIITEEIFEAFKNNDENKYILLEEFLKTNVQKIIEEVVDPMDDKYNNEYYKYTGGGNISNLEETEADENHFIYSGTSDIDFKVYKYEGDGNQDDRPVNATVDFKLSNNQREILLTCDSESIEFN